MEAEKQAFKSLMHFDIDGTYPFQRQFKKSLNNLLTCINYCQATKRGKENLLHGGVNVIRNQI